MTGHKDFVHLNGDLLCAIDVRTSGPDPQEHDILDICILPLTSNLTFSRVYLPYMMQIKPRYVEFVDKRHTSRTCKEPLSHYINQGLSYYQSATLFDEWFDRFQLKEGKRIQPLVYDTRILPFIREWLGPNNFADRFSEKVRSVESVALFINDKAAFKATPYPLPKTTLSYLCNKLSVERDNLKDTLDTAKVLGLVYKEMMKLYVG